MFSLPTYIATGICHGTRCTLHVLPPPWLPTHRPCISHLWDHRGLMTTFMVSTKGWGWNFYKAMEKDYHMCCFFKCSSYGIKSDRKWWWEVHCFGFPFSARSGALLCASKFIDHWDIAPFSSSICALLWQHRFELHLCISQSAASKPADSTIYHNSCM